MLCALNRDVVVVNLLQDERVIDFETESTWPDPRFEELTRHSKWRLPVSLGVNLQKVS